MLSVISIAVSAQEVLIDQRSDTLNLPFTPMLPITGNDQPLGYQPGQQFKPTLNALDFVDMEIRNDSILEEAFFQVRIHEDTIYGPVVGTTETLTIFFPPNVSRFNLPATVPLTPGRTYVLEISQVNQPRLGWATPQLPNSAYADGQAYYHGSTINGDLWFREGVIVPVLSVGGPPDSAGFLLTASGKSGSTYELQATSELPAIEWKTLLTFTLSGSVSNILDTNATNSTARFYRLKSS